MKLPVTTASARKINRRVSYSNSTRLNPILIETRLRAPAYGSFPRIGKNDEFVA